MSNWFRRTLTAALGAVFLMGGFSPYSFVCAAETESSADLAGESQTESSADLAGESQTESSVDAAGQAETETPADTVGEVQTVGFSEEEIEHNRAFGTLKVGYVAGRIPVSLTDDAGEFGGISRDIFDRIQELSGLQFEYVELPQGDVTYDYLQGEKFDLVTSVEYNEENKRARGILISHPYLTSKKVVVSRSDLVFDREASFRAAISTGSQTLKKVMASMYPNFELLDFPTLESCFDAVCRGEADILIQNQFVAEHYLYRPRYEDLTVVPVVGMDDQLCFSVVTPLEYDPEKSSREVEILDAIDRAIEMLSEDEVTNFIIENTMKYPYEYTFSDITYRYRYTVIAVTVAVIAIFLLIFVSAHFYVRSASEKAEARAKSNFLSSMSHEIRTPLHGMIGLNYLMAQHLDDRPKMAEYLRQSASTTRYLQSLINDMLDMSMLEKRNMVLNEAPFSVGDALAMVRIIEENRMRSKDIDFTMEADLPHPFVVGDEVRVEQIILNMTDNAFKFTPEGGRVSVKAGQELQENGRVLTRIEVADNGRGISEEFQKELFRTFTQESSAVSSGNQGTGLGMPISRLLAELMDGDISVSSRPGEGSCFVFSFAAQIAEGVSEDGTAHEGEQPDAGKKKTLHILIAEDNELNAGILTEILQAAGFRTSLASNGQEAVDLFASSAPGEYDYILMDLRMPVKDGFEAAREIRHMSRSDAKTVRIFACTANTLQEDRDRAKASGMDGFVSKPVDMKKLLEMLK